MWQMEIPILLEERREIIMWTGGHYVIMSNTISIDKLIFWMTSRTIKCHLEKRWLSSRNCEKMLKIECKQCLKDKCSQGIKLMDHTWWDIVCQWHISILDWHGSYSKIKSELWEVVNHPIMSDRRYINEVHRYQSWSILFISLSVEVQIRYK
jgi:hypothetical protein